MSDQLCDEAQDAPKSRPLMRPLAWTGALGDRGRVINFWSLSGLTPYENARRLQLRLVELRALDRIPDTVLFLEHEPVVTRGRGLQRGSKDVDANGVALPRQMPLPAPLPAGIAFAESERGGDLTYHGPGQLVIYPIFKLDGKGFAPHHDIGGFLRRFEQIFIDLVSELAGDGTLGCAREGATGVWIKRDGESEASARKIASMGIAVRRWVTYHGLAVNCVNDLSAFHTISPCGFSPEVMTRLADWLPSGSRLARDFLDWSGPGRAALEQKIADRLAGVSSHILKLEGLTEAPFMEASSRAGWPGSSTVGAGNFENLAALAERLL